jgi:hypothetical protein
VPLLSQAAQGQTKLDLDSSSGVFEVEALGDCKTHHTKSQEQAQ